MLSKLNEDEPKTMALTKVARIMEMMTNPLSHILLT